MSFHGKSNFLFVRFNFVMFGEKEKFVPESFQPTAKWVPVLTLNHWVATRSKRRKMKMEKIKTKTMRQRLFNCCQLDSQGGQRMRVLFVKPQSPVFVFISNLYDLGN